MIGAAVGGAIGGLLLIGAVAAWLWRQGRARRDAYLAKRVPLTFNSAYETQSNGAASNFDELQMFEFREAGPPGTVRARTRMH